MDELSTPSISHAEIVTALAHLIERLEDEISDHRRMYPRSFGGPDTRETALHGKIGGVWNSAEALGLDHLIEAERRRIQQTQRRVYL